MDIESKIELKGNTKFCDEFSEEVYNHTYKFGNEDVNDTHLRVAKDLAKVEKDSSYWTEKFLWALEDFKFVPGGRITSNAGTGLKGTTYINCFVDGFTGEDQDSMEGILAALGRQALILKSEGGYGFCADVMRPKGAFINGIGNETPGAVRMLDMWDTQSAVITAGSGKKSEHKKAKQKIRKGAQMVTMSVHHPDIEEFITAKQTAGRLTKFNMSVLVTDEFMEAVKNDAPWDLIFPDYDAVPAEYKKHWNNADIRSWKAMGYPIKVYKTLPSARVLWDLIMNSTYTRNEPGVLFIDTINRMNNLYYTEHINATNPCLTGDALVTARKVANIPYTKEIMFVTDRKSVPDIEAISSTEDFELKETLRMDELVDKVKAGEKWEALSYNTETKATEFKEITFGDMTRKQANVIELELEDGTTVKLTPDHKVYTSNRGWVEAAQLTTEDQLVRI